MPAAFYRQALCVHDGWHYKRVWSRWGKRHAAYRFGHFYFRRTAKTYSNGEGAWHGSVSSLYGGGLQFMLGTWHRAGGSGVSTVDIANASPAEQIYRAFRIVRDDGGSWREWPNTSRACGLR